MRLSRRRLWIAALVIIGLVVLPMPIAERYTSPTQDGQYLTHPVRSFRFVVAAARVSTSATLNTSGEALARAKEVFAGSDHRPTKVELLFFPSGDHAVYSFTTLNGNVLTITEAPQFVWEVWGVSPGSGATASSDVIGLLDYETGEMLAAVH
ncbi:MAG: hypothetical protein M5U22_14995 [Thermoleophilia bacterium]|nr:hypothetical protein [Thermoleophilia bacterium]